MQRDLLKLISKLQSHFLNFTLVLRHLAIKVAYNNTLTQKKLLAFE